MLGTGIPTSNACQGGFGWTTTCHATTNGTQVDVGADTRSLGGQSGPATRPQTGSATNPSRDDTGTAPAAPPACTTALCRPNYTVVTLPDVTAADLASFIPAAPAITGEPQGLGVVGMPTNLVATASTHALTGTLFGYDVTVRFSPTAFRFEHGDGTARAASTGGAPWQRLGMPEFSPTATSHVYGEPGRYRVTARVIYQAAVDFGTGAWRPVTGAVTSAGVGYDVRVVEVHTALVARTCIEDPAGPGC
ncbi:hypothetical protein AB2L57_11575 [Microbacterium sp. HA-8]|uniref:hypothetical protein n=1 Tax=Microbacterium sp. HA-8 TaxID=3234200 RepID=UPI0038F77D61